MMKELIEIQTSLNAPKDLTNKFGGYKYRSAESIMEALKPLLKKHSCFLNLTDKVEVHGDRFYIGATATITNSAGETMSSTSYAREEASKKGCDAAQITGGASSYARKYALCGLFAIDGGDDPDRNDNRESGSSAPSAPSESADKPVIAEGGDRWLKAIDYCAKNNLRAEDLRKKYTIDDATCAKMNEILSLRKDFE